MNHWHIIVSLFIRKISVQMPKISWSLPLSAFSSLHLEGFMSLRWAPPSWPAQLQLLLRAVSWKSLHILTGARISSSYLHLHVFFCHYLYSISCNIIVNHIRNIQSLFDLILSHWSVSFSTVLLFLFSILFVCVPSFSVLITPKASSYLASKDVLSLCRLPDGDLSLELCLIGKLFFL